MKKGVCGKPTYFYKHNILVDYKTFLEEQEVNATFPTDIPDDEPALIPDFGSSSAPDQQDSDPFPFSGFDEELPFN